MADESFLRLLDYHRRRYRLGNGWCIRFRVEEAPASAGRPHGVKYSFTLHDVDMTRLLGFDNAHGLPRVQAYDHRHRFRSLDDMVPYAFESADKLIGDFFDAVERACAAEGVAFEFDDDGIEMEEDDGDPEAAW